MVCKTWYHKTLRTVTLLCALILLFDSGVLSPVTQQLSQNAQRYVANGVGMSAGIVPTETNRLTAELTAKEAELEAREQALEQRELNTGINAEGRAATNSTYYLTMALIFLLILVIFNYVFDYIRSLKVAKMRYE